MAFFNKNSFSVDELSYFIKAIAKQEIAKSNQTYRSLLTGTIDSVNGNVYTVSLDGANQDLREALPLNNNTYLVKDYVYLIEVEKGNKELSLLILDRVSSADEIYFNLPLSSRFNPESSTLINIAPAGSAYHEYSIQERDTIKMEGVFEVSADFSSNGADTNYGLKIKVLENEIVLESYVLDINDFEGQPFNMENLSQSKVFHIANKDILERMTKLRVEKFGDSSATIQNLIVKAGRLIAADAAIHVDLGTTGGKNYFSKENVPGVLETVELKAQLYHNSSAIDNATVQYYWLLEDETVTEGLNYLAVAGKGWYCFNKSEERLVILEDESTTSIKVWDNNSKSIAIPKDSGLFKNYENKVKCLACYSGNYVESEPVTIYNYEKENFEVRIAQTPDTNIILSEKDNITLTAIIYDKNTENEVISNDYTFKYQWGEIKNGVKEFFDGSKTKDLIINSSNYSDGVHEFFCDITVEKGNSKVSVEEANPVTIRIALVEGRKLQIVYSDNEKIPSKPYKTKSNGIESTNIGSGKTWHEDLTDSSIWMCQKVAESLDGDTNTWGSIIQIQGIDGKDGTGVSIKGVAYTRENVTDNSIEQYFELYSDPEFGTVISSAEPGDAYLVNGYLMVYIGKQDDNKNFQCVGKIKGEPGAAGTPAPILQLIYKYSSTTPNTPEGDNPSGWSFTEPTPIANQRLYMSQKMSDQTEWSTPVPMTGLDGVNGTTPKVEIKDGYWYIDGEQSIKAEGEDGKTPTVEIKDGYWCINGTTTTVKVTGPAGKDGSDIEYVYWLCKTEEDKPTTAPTVTDIEKFMPSELTERKWYPSPQGITDIYKYEYMSVRTKPAGNETSWGLFSTPVIWSKWGEKGQDGDGVEYKYRTYATKQSFSSAPTIDSNWKDEPSGVDAVNRYEYVCQLKYNGETKETKASSPRLWNEYVSSVAKINEYYLWTKTDDSLGESWKGLSWTENEIPDRGTEDKYLWNYEKTLDGNSVLLSETAPVIIYRHSEDGTPGASGTSGHTIDEITEYYANHDSGTEAPAVNLDANGKLIPDNTWKSADDIDDVNSNTPFRWNLEEITFKKINDADNIGVLPPKYGTPQCLYEMPKFAWYIYTQSDNSPEPPGKGLTTSSKGEQTWNWQTNLPENDGKIWWACTKIDYSINSTTVTWSQPYKITAKDGIDAQPFKTIEEVAYYSTQSTVPTTGIEFHDDWKTEADFFANWTGGDSANLQTVYKSNRQTLQEGDEGELYYLWSVAITIPDLDACTLAAKYQIKNDIYVAGFDSETGRPIISETVSALGPITGDLGNPEKYPVPEGGLPEGDVGRWCQLYGRTIISGGAIVTGTITADKMRVNSLSAIQANMGSLTAGEIKSPDFKTGIKIWGEDIPISIDLVQTEIEATPEDVFKHEPTSDGSAITITKYIGDYTDVVIPSTIKGLPVTSIAVSAFWYLSALTSVIIPDSVTSINSVAFSGCSGLTRVIIPDSVTSIGENVFNGCSSLTSVIIPDSVTSIGQGVFYECSSLTIYCEAGSQPSGWHSNWNSSDRPVYWYSENEPPSEGNYWHYDKEGFKISCDDENMIDSKYFAVTKNGEVTASKANISGTITATRGEIAGWDVTPQGLSKEDTNTGLKYGLNSNPDLVAPSLISEGTSQVIFYCQNNGEMTFQILADGSLYVTAARFSGDKVILNDDVMLADVPASDLLSAAGLLSVD